MAIPGFEPGLTRLMRAPLCLVELYSHYCRGSTLSYIAFTVASRVRSPNLSALRP